MFSCFCRDIANDELRLQARQGYPSTRTPYIPPILESAVDTRILEGHNATVKIFLANNGSDLVKIKSLEFIRDFLIWQYNMYPAIRQGLMETPLPPNTIAVAFTQRNFNVGDTCTDFIPTQGEWESGYFSYQRLSQNCQATYLNLDGTQFLAGITYFPVLHGMPNFVLDGKLIYLARKSAENYPIMDRTIVDHYHMHNFYGRYCETAGKRVLVNFANEKRGVCHQEIDFNKKDAYKYTKCEECAEEKKAYKWVPPRDDTPSIPSSSAVPVPQASELPANSENSLSPLALAIMQLVEAVLDERLKALKIRILREAGREYN